MEIKGEMFKWYVIPLIPLFLIGYYVIRNTNPESVLGKVLKMKTKERENEWKMK